MKNIKSLFRKTPVQTLKNYVDRRCSGFPADFDWSQKDTQLAKALDKVLSELMHGQEETLRSELEQIHELTEGDGWLAIDEICRAKNIDVPEDGGAEGAAFFLVLNHHDLFERVIAAASFYRFSGGKRWSCFEIDSDGFSIETIQDDDARTKFIDAILKKKKFDRSRQIFEPDWFRASRHDAVTTQPVTILYLTLYLQERPVSELAVEAGSITRALRSQVAEVVIAMNPSAKEIEICARGGRKFHEPVANAFSEAFLPDKPRPVRVVKRHINFDVLRRQPDLRLFPEDQVANASVVKLSFYRDDLRSHFQHPSSSSKIYNLLDNQFMGASPVRNKALITAATIKVKREKGAGQMLTIDLTYPNSTTLRNQTEKDRKLSYTLLERWGLLPEREPLIEGSE